MLQEHGFLKKTNISSYNETEVHLKSQPDFNLLIFTFKYLITEEILTSYWKCWFSSAAECSFYWLEASVLVSTSASVCVCYSLRKVCGGSCSSRVIVSIDSIQWRNNKLLTCYAFNNKGSKFQECLYDSMPRAERTAV